MLIGHLNPRNQFIKSVVILLKILAETHRAKSIVDQNLSDIVLIEKPEVELKIKEFELLRWKNERKRDIGMKESIDEIEDS